MTEVDRDAAHYVAAIIKRELKECYDKVDWSDTELIYRIEPRYLYIISIDPRYERYLKMLARVKALRATSYYFWTAIPLGFMARYCNVAMKPSDRSYAG